MGYILVEIILFLLSLFQNIQKDFNFTKERIIELTEHLDKLEVLYNKILGEYQNRTKTK